MPNEIIYKSRPFVFRVTDLLDVFQDEPYLFCLDSSLAHPSRGRYSFVGFDPFYIYQGFGPGVLAALKESYAPFKSESAVSLTPLPGGIVGALGYDWGLTQDKIKTAEKEKTLTPDAVFGFYDTIITIDHAQKMLHVTSTGLPERSSALQKKRAQERLAHIWKRIELFSAHKAQEKKMLRPENEVLEDVALKSNLTRGQFIRMVYKALDYIAQGDIYQINLSQRFEMPASLDIEETLQIYKALRELSPSSFGGYFQAGDFQMISSSPERFLSMKNHLVETRPMKGTRPRGLNPEDDVQNKCALLESAKEKAELLMITDLERNDLGKVCECGTVRVSEMRNIEEYASVFQATSNIVGKLKSDKDGFDLLAACFPGGSVTGCPKLRAMEIIEELEPTRRGMYTGTLGYMSFAGNLDFNILIRTLIIEKNRLSFQVGSGIVADSDPSYEYEETLTKAQAMQQALRQTFSKIKKTSAC
jgi:para-aminobenzoate synthetase component 1